MVRVRRIGRVLALAVATGVAALTALGDEGSLNCGTGGLPQGWQCTQIGGPTQLRWCEHRANQICDPGFPLFNNYNMVKDAYHISCMRQNPFGSTSCAYCTTPYQDGCCWTAGEPQPSCHW